MIKIICKKINCYYKKQNIYDTENKNIHIKRAGINPLRFNCTKSDIYQLIKIQQKPLHQL